jgi:NADH:ubiquinone oxidoreductase subunit 2 (subunit N)
MLIMAFSFSILYGYLGTLNIIEIRLKTSLLNLENTNLILHISLILIIFSLFFKIGLAPCHF